MSRSASPSDDQEGIERSRSSEHRYEIDCKDCSAQWELVAVHNVCEAIARRHGNMHNHKVEFEIIETHREMAESETDTEEESD